MPTAEIIRNNEKLKKFVHYLLVPKNEARPRRWVSWFVNPFVHKRGKGSKVRWRVRMDVLPFNQFILGKRATIENFCTINNGVGDVSIGENTLIGMGNVIIGPVTIGNNVIFAQNIVASGLNHTYQNPDLPILAQGVTTAPIIVEDDCWIGANVVITAGTHIGKHCVIAAGAVVTKDIPPYSVAVGNPAKVIRQYDAATKEWVRM